MRVKYDMQYLCPVCGYPELTDVPYDDTAGPSLEICPSCGFQFGYDDDVKEFTHAAWRQQWIDGGMAWWTPAPPPPPSWNPREQLARAGLL